MTSFPKKSSVQFHSVFSSWVPCHPSTEHRGLQGPTTARSNACDQYNKFPVIQLGSCHPPVQKPWKAPQIKFVPLSLTFTVFLSSVIATWHPSPCPTSDDTATWSSSSKAPFILPPSQAVLTTRQLVLCLSLWINAFIPEDFKVIKNKTGKNHLYTGFSDSQWKCVLFQQLV